jgi:hypothetical protein
MTLVSQLHFNQLFSINKSYYKNHLVFSYLYRFPLFICPYYHSSWVFFISSTLTLQMANTRNYNNNNAEDNNGENNQNVNPPPPLHLLLSKCWLYKHKCFRLCRRPLSTCKLLNLKLRHRRQGIGLEIFSSLRHPPFLMLWSRWMLIIGSSLLRRSYKWCSTTIMGRCY